MTRHEIECEEALRWLSDFLDHELPEEERDAVQHHLSTCRTCFSRAHFEQQLKSKLSTLAKDELAPDAQERFARLLQQF